MKEWKKEKYTSDDLLVGLQVIISYCKKYQKIFLGTITFVLILALFEAARPYVIGKFLDAVVAPENISLFGFTFAITWVYVLVYGLLLGGRTFFKWLTDRFSRKLMMLVIQDHRIVAMRKLLMYPTSYFKTKRMGEIHEIIGRANSSLSNIIGYNAPFFSVQIISILFSLVIATTISPILTLILVTGVIAFLLLVKQITPRVSVAVKEADKERNKVQSDYHEIITNIFEIKRNTTEKNELKKIETGYGEKVYTTGLREHYLWVDNNALRMTVIFGTEIIVFGVSIILIGKSMITVGELIAINLYSRQTFMPLVRLSDMWLYLTRGVIRIKEGEEMLDDPKEDYRPELSDPKYMVNGNVSFDEVRFAYGEKEKDVIKGMSFDVKQGQTVALVGESGVGKTTAIELLGGFYFPRKGEVLIDGVSTRDFDLHALRSQIGYVSQEVTLFNDTVLNNIKYGAGRRVTNKEVYAAAKQARANVFIKEFPRGYKQVVGERGIKLSVGQKQRVGIARAILRDPKILILDEPTSALDSKTEKYITASLKELMKGRTTFIIAHRLSTVRHADQILVFEKGRVRESGTHKELMKQDGLYAEMYNEHVGLS